jgi:hypothetical protein
MVAPIVAAAAPAVISSATEDDGLINRAFKIVMLIGMLALGAIAIVILSFVINIADIVNASSNIFSLAIGFVSPVGRVGAIGTVITYFATAFGFGGRN